MTKIKAILFDMDGVLIDAKEWHYEALNRALALFGLEISRIDHLSTYDGLPTRKKLKMLSLERGLPEALHEFINEMKQIYTVDAVHARCFPNFVHEYALSKLKNDGYKIAVCSNSVRNSVDLMMNKSSLSQYLDCSLSNEDVTIGKPHPEIYQLAMARLEVEPEECLILEDNENGIAAAQASGGHVMIIKDVVDANYMDIKANIAKIEGA